MQLLSTESSILVGQLRDLRRSKTCAVSNGVTADNIVRVLAHREDFEALTCMRNEIPGYDNHVAENCGVSQSASASLSSKSLKSFISWGRW